MIVYSVTVCVEENVHEEWLNWMKTKHIPDVMQTGYFESYAILKVLSKRDGDEGVSYNLQYKCESMAKLHQYQINCAAALQKEHTEKYNDKAVAFRTLLEEM